MKMQCFVLGMEAALQGPTQLSLAVLHSIFQLQIVFLGFHP